MDTTTPAFPLPQESDNTERQGLTKREYFAGLAMQGMLAYDNRHDISGWDAIAKDAVKCADELLKELEQ